MPTATLTGPVLLPDDTPFAGVPVKVTMIAGNAKALGYVNGSARAGVATTKTDANGNFSIEVPTLDPADVTVYPPGSYYEVRFGGGGGRFKEYVVKVQPTEEATYIITDPAVLGEQADLLPPDFVQVQPTISSADVAVLFTTYLEDNPSAVADAVDDALLVDPPLKVSENGADVDDADQFRLNINAAADSDVDAALSALTARIAALEVLEASDPALRTSTLAGAGLVTAPDHDSVEITFPGGIPTFTTDP